MTRPHRQTSPDDKIVWLQQHRWMWDGLLPLFEDWRDSERWTFPALHALRLQAVADGLYSTKTFWKDVEYSLMKHIRSVRTREGRRP